MKDTAYECKTSDELREDILALRLRLAFQEELEEEVNALVKESENPDRVILEMMERADSRVIQKIRQKIRRKNGKHLLFAVVPKVGKAAAACLLVFFIGLSTAIAMNSSVRVEMLNFIMRIEEKYASLGFEDHGAFIEVPAGWKGYYYPTYIPEGFDYVSTDGYAVYYERAGQEFIFSEYESGSGVNIDTEGAETKFTDVNGRSALAVEKNGWATLAWAVSNRYFIIELQGEIEEAVGIAEHVMMIK